MINSGRFPRKRLFTREFISPVTSMKTSGAELDRNYKNNLKRAAILSLFIPIIFFQYFPKKLHILSGLTEPEPFNIIIEEIPRTEQLSTPPPPPQPVVAIPSEDPDIPDDLTITETEWDFSEMPPPPPQSHSEEDAFVFIKYDRPPEPIGGLASIIKYINYPKMARIAGVESKVIVGVLIDEEGNCIKTQILQEASKKLGFEEEAKRAVMKLKWIPALQRDIPIKVWISVPVVFKLN